jgi:sensor histidine kinase YesM
MSSERMQTIEHMMLLSEDTIRLHQQLAIEEQKVETRTAYVFVLVLVAVILLLMLYYYMMNRRRRLQTERDMLRLRLANVRNRISPHFVFNVINRHISRV